MYNIDIDLILDVINNDKLPRDEIAKQVGKSIRYISNIKYHNSEIYNVKFNDILKLNNYIKKENQ